MDSFFFVVAGWPSDKKDRAKVDGLVSILEGFQKKDMVLIWDSMLINLATLEGGGRGVRSRSAWREMDRSIFYLLALALSLALALALAFAFAFEK